MTASIIAQPKHFFQDHEDWHFSVFSPQDVKHFCNQMGEDPLTRALQKAHAQELCLTLMCTGNCGNPIWLPINPGLVNTLKQAWHSECCKEHGLRTGSEGLASLDDYITLMGYH